MKIITKQVILLFVLLNISAPSWSATIATVQRGVGNIGVTILFPESKPSTLNMETWDLTRVDLVRAKILDALQWWADRAAENGVSLTFHLFVYYPSDLPIDYEPIAMIQDDHGDWINDVMDEIGFSDFLIPVSMEVRNLNIATVENNPELNLDGAFSVFVVDSLVDYDGWFPGTGSEKRAYAYRHGPYTVLTYDNGANNSSNNGSGGIDNFDRTMAHETGHILGAPDEYSEIEDEVETGCYGGEQNTYVAGYSNVNCASVAGNPQALCIMRNSRAYSTDTIGYWTKGMIGWDPLPDIAPPTPNPVKFSISPMIEVTTTNQMSMQSEEISDDSGGLEYYFEQVSGEPLTGSSGWQPSRDHFADIIFNQNTEYCFTVKAKDYFNNESVASLASCKYSYFEVPQGVSFGEVTASSIELNAIGTFPNLAVANSGLEFLGNGIGGGDGFLKVQLTTVTATGLLPNRQYNYSVKAINGDGVQTAYPPYSFKYTLASTPYAPTITNATLYTLDLDISPGYFNPVETRYAIYSTSHGFYINASGTNNGTTPVWQTDANWGNITVKGLAPGTAYTFSAKALNDESVETILGPDATVATLADTDGDGISDFDEMNRDGNPADYTPGVDLDPNNHDTDGDGKWDGAELVFGSDPLDAASNSWPSPRRVSTDTNENQSNGGANWLPDISTVGRYVVFRSYASNLVAGDTNGHWDIFIKDTYTGETKRVSTDTLGIQANDDSSWPSINEDGRFVAFESEASNLVDADTNQYSDVFTRDTKTGITQRISTNSAGVEGNGNSYQPAFNTDGRYVAFFSYANNLVVGDFNATGDIFIKDIITGVTTRVSSNSTGVEGNGSSIDPSLSADGRYVVFESSADNLVANDTNNARDIFVKDLQTNVVTCVSTNSTGLQTIGGDSITPVISSNGRYVTFSSEATNLVAGDTNNLRDVFIKDTLTNITTRANTDNQNLQALGGISYAPDISANGRYVVFFSNANNLTAVDANTTGDVFVKDTQTGNIDLVNLNSEGGQAESDFWQVFPVISAMGHYIAYSSRASNLVTADTNGEFDIFLAKNLVSTPDADGDGIRDYLDTDDDNDGLLDDQEAVLGTDILMTDTDSDGVSDFEEVNRDGNPGDYALGVDLDPNNPDTDGDGIWDGAELASATDPLDPSSLSRSFQVLQFTSGSFFEIGTTIQLLPGPDGGIIIGQVQTALASSCPESGLEMAGIDAVWNFSGCSGMHFTTTPVSFITDTKLDFSGWRAHWSNSVIPLGGDPMNYSGDTQQAVINCTTTPCQDGDTFTLNYDAHIAAPSPFAGTPYHLYLQGIIDGAGIVCPVDVDPTQTDTDNDGLKDACDADDDNDGLTDSAEVNIHGTDPLDVDTDNDGFNDTVEINAGTDPLDNQSIPANGDINNDGSVNVVDMLLATQIVLGLKTPTAEEMLRGDVAPLTAGVPDPDAVFNAGDLLVIQRKVFGLVSF